jgi:hypothetical protein
MVIESRYGTKVKLQIQLRITETKKTQCVHQSSMLFACHQIEPELKPRHSLLVTVHPAELKIVGVNVPGPEFEDQSKAARIDRGADGWIHKRVSHIVNC